MLTLYVKTGCPYCAMVIKKLEELGISYEEKNISDPKIAAELIERGGKRQVPFMEDDDPCATAGHHTPCLVDNDIEMYESANIVDYLDKNYEPVKGDQKSTTPAVQLHRESDEDVCEACQ